LGITRREARQRAGELLAMVGIPDSERRLGQYPHQFSGGMRQRMMIAMALACNPSLILADEPTTALDVTIQAQILELMKDLSRRLAVAMQIITHNLGVVARYADRVNVMYAGRIVERGTARELYANPRHPYTLGLLRSVPRLDPPRRDPRARRRVGLRQDDDRPVHHPARAADERADRLRGARPHDPRRGRAAAGAPQDAGDLPGPVQLAQPADDGRADHRRAPGGARDRPRPGPARGACARAPGARRTPASACAALSSPALRRTASARGHRARARRRARAHHLRRAGLGPRRLDPGADHQPAGRSPGAVWSHVPVRRPRPFG